MNADKILQAIDMIAEEAGSPKISNIFKQFESKIPNEFKDIVLAQVKQEAAKAIAQGLQQSQSEIQKLVTDPEVISKLKGMGPQDDASEHNATDAE